MPQLDPPAMIPRPAKCLHCGYCRDPVPLQPRCPECGHEYPVYDDAERWLLKSARELRRSWMLLLAAELTGLAVFVIPVCLLMLSLPATLIAVFVLAARILNPDPLTTMAYDVGTQYSRTLYDNARREARLMLIVGVALGLGFVLLWSRMMRP